MDFHSRKIFLILYITKIIIFEIIVIFISTTRNYESIVSVSVIFASGIYTIIKKESSHLLAFCIVNIILSIMFINAIVELYISYYSGNFGLLINGPFNDNDFKEWYDIVDTKNYTKFIKIFIIPNIITCALLIIFDILFIILFIIVIKRRNKYWNVISHIPKNLKNLKNFHTTYNRYLVLLHISLCLIAILNVFIIRVFSSDDKGLLGIRTFFIFLPFFVLTFGSKIIKKELKIHVYFIYIALIAQEIFMIYFIIECYHYYQLLSTLLELLTPAIVLTIPIIVPFVLLALLLTSLFVSTILCHRNFGKNLKIYLMYDSDLGKEYAYSNSDSDNDDDDDDDDCDNDDEKVSETLKRYWSNIKTVINNTRQKFFY